MLIIPVRVLRNQDIAEAVVLAEEECMNPWE